MSVYYAFNGRKYKERDPSYYDLEGIGWYDDLRSELPDIREKVLAFIKTEGLEMPEYFHVTRVTGRSWNIISFMIWQQRNEKMINMGKDVFEYFEDIPGLVSLSVSILQPQTRIKGHYGDTDAVYRIHIPIYIPAQLPDCGISVNGIARSWVENEIIVFNDARFHEAWNMTDEPRIVIIIDVVKEEFLHLADKISANVMSAVLYERFFLKYKFAKIFPTVLKNIIRVLGFRNSLLKGIAPKVIDKLFNSNI